MDRAEKPTDKDLCLAEALRVEHNIARAKRARDLDMRKITAALNALTGGPEDLGPFLEPPAPFEFDPYLEAFAQNTVHKWIDTRTYGHADRDGNKVFARLKAAGFPVRFCSENIAFGHESAQQAHGSFMKSSGHRGNILNPGYRYVGIGTAMTTHDIVTYWNTNENREMPVGKVRLWCVVVYTPVGG